MRTDRLIGCDRIRTCTPDTEDELATRLTTTVTTAWRLHRESNPDLELRKLVCYPLHHGGE